MIDTNSPSPTAGRKLTGGCLCGKVRYTLDAEPLSVSNCNSRHCRKQSGSHRSLNWLLPAGAIRFTGELASFHDVGGSGKPVYREFCPACGSPIRTIMVSVPGKEFLKSGSLDDTPPDEPVFAIFAANAAPWEVAALTCTQYDQNR